MSELIMKQLSRRTIMSALSAGAALSATGMTGLIVPAQAKPIAPTPSMRGGSNNYRPGAPIVERIGGGGF
ncbi:MAG: twin-arginine translocation pathway signal, partial [Pseudomonadota bacterium]